MLKIFLVTMTDRFEDYTVAVFADSITHAREVADVNYGDRILHVRRAK